MIKKLLSEALNIYRYLTEQEDDFDLELTTTIKFIRPNRFVGFRIKKNILKGLQP